ncbi:MAG TPA: ATP-binding cassette domain-containing protein, partial [Rhodoglobus sp.]|nr:ATP-binding cassette domain-containing protein [Rhodoglobus sp.]
MNDGSVAIQWSSVTISLPTGDPVVDSVSLEVRPGEIVCLVGESGSGKTTTALAAFGYTAPGLAVTAGEVSGGGPNGAVPRLSFVPQNPATALNPSMRVARILRDAAQVKQAGTPDDAEIDELLLRVGLPGSAAFRARFPHQLSGGQQQRV